jgi:hypothetical protein
VRGAGTSRRPRRSALTVLLLFLCAALATPATSADATQARAMLALLSAPPASRAALVAPVLAAPGTDLVVAQQNISRRVTKAQYAEVLRAFAAGREPRLSPADPGERSRKGMDGLLKDVRPSLEWGSEHAALLKERLDALERLDLLTRARETAARFLPTRVDLSPRVYVVAGGRAGAAALETGEIYFDLLATSFAAETGKLPHYPTPDEQVEFVAHEVHHQGLGRILDRDRSRLRLDARGAKAFDLLTALDLEGSASYLINGHRDLAGMSKDPQFAENLARSEELIASCRSVLRRVLDEGLTGDAYDAAITPMLGSGWHAAGAAMLAAIDRDGGLDAVMRVVGDPRALFAAYDAAAAKAGGSAPAKDDSELASRLQHLGEPP